MKVEAVKCPKCGDIVFSRAAHDFRTCSCGSVSIDGGRNYTKISSNLQIDTIELDIKQTQEQLYNDWNNAKDRYGLIKGNK